MFSWKYLDINNHGVKNVNFLEKLNLLMRLKLFYAFGQFYEFAESEIRGNLHLVCWELSCDVMCVFWLKYLFFLSGIDRYDFMFFDSKIITFLFIFHNFKSPKISLTVSPYFIITFLEIFGKTNKISIKLIVSHTIWDNQLNITIDLFYILIGRWRNLSFDSL